MFKIGSVMRAFILIMPIYLGTLVYFNVHAAMGAHQDVTNRGSMFKSCLRADSEEDALCAEGNVASFIRQNKQEILTLKRMGALEDERPKELDYSKVKEILIKIWGSETNVAAWFTRMPQIAKTDLTKLVEQVWSDPYTIHSDEVGSLDKLKQMLILLNAVVRLSQEVLL